MNPAEQIEAIVQARADGDFAPLLPKMRALAAELREWEIHTEYAVLRVRDDLEPEVVQFPATTPLLGVNYAAFAEGHPDEIIMVVERSVTTSPWGSA